MKLKGISAVLADKERLAKWQANAGLRSKLPDRYLTSSQRMMRRERIRRGTPVFEGSDLTVGDAESQARRDAELQYGSQRSQLDQQKVDLGARQMRDAAWFKAYQDSVSRAQQTLSDVTRDVNAGSPLQSAAAAQGDSPLAQNAGNVRSALASIAQGRMNSRNVADVGLMGALTSAAGAQGQMNEGAIRAALSKLGVSKRDLAAQYGAYRQKRQQELKDDSRRRLLEDRAYNLDQYKAAQAAADNAMDVNQYGYLKSDWAKLSTEERQSVIKEFAKSKGGKSKSGSSDSGSTDFRTSDQQDKWWGEVNQIIGRWGQPQRKRDGTLKVDKNGHAIRYGERDFISRGFAPEQIRIAYLLLKQRQNGRSYLTKKNVAFLHDYGIQVKSRYPVVG